MSATIPRSGPSAARTATIVLAVVALVIGAVAAVGGGVLLLVFGSDGQLTSETRPVSTSTAAVVSDTATITDTSQAARALGAPNLRLQGDGGNATGLFIGIGPAAEVDRYLEGVAIDQATDFELDPYVLSLTRRDGAATAAAPSSQAFWVASASTRGHADLTWRIRDGAYRVVVMNADGSPGMQSQLGIGVGLPRMFPFAMTIFIVGLVLVLAGASALALGRSRRTRRTP